MAMEYLFLALVFLIAGIVPEITGFGVATVSMSMLSFVLPLPIAIPLVAIISVTATGIVAFQTKTSGLLRYLSPLLLGSSLGVFLGMIFLNFISEDYLKIILGVFLIAYSLYGLIFKGCFLPISKITGAITGLVAGFFGALFNIHGPLVGLYSSSNKKLNKLEVKDLIATYMFFTGSLTILGHTISSRITGEVLTLALFALPFLFLGLFIGEKIFCKINSKWVKKGVYSFVLLAGIILLL